MPVAAPTRRDRPLDGAGTRWLAGAGLLAGAAALIGCAGMPAAADSELTIFAAASLTASFTDLAEEFAEANPGVTVRPISFDGSPTLATQLLEGAPADVFAAASFGTLDLVGDLAAEPLAFASTTMQLAVRPGNPLGIDGLDGLDRPGIDLVLCAPEVPCGSTGRTLLDLAGVSAQPVSEEQSVTAVLARVQSGEADVGLVYSTDIAAAGDTVTGVPIAGADRVPVEYPIATITGSANPAPAQAFVDFVLSPAGQSILREHGFSAP